MDKVKKIALDGGVDSTDIIMGIDLGTTNSAVAIYTAGTVPKLCAMSADNKYTMQSCVRWDGGNRFTVGQEAYNERYKPNVIYSVKRIMGSDKTIKLRNPQTGETIGLTPAQVSAKILKELARRVREFYPGIHRCIITVPAYFNQRQIKDTLEAARIANLECVQILKEPTSASYIYSMLGYAKDGSVMVYDLGGGTFDVTIMSFLKKADIPKKVISTLKRLYKIDVNSVAGDSSSLYFCRVLGTYGDTNLGGDDIDKETADLVLDGKSIRHEAYEELVLRCEQFKKLTAQAQDVYVDGEMYRISREHVTKATRIVYDRTLEILNTIPEDQLRQVNTIVLVGGSTKNQAIVDFLNETFPDKEISRVLDPDATVALGAGAVAKDMMDGRGLAYQDVLPLAIGVLDSETTVDICIPKNTAMPYSVTRTYHTMYDNQTAVSISVYQGLSHDPKECTYLGTLRVTDLPPRKAGETNILVTFILSVQGRLKVTTTIDGVSEIKELVVDSIFNIADSGSDSSTTECFNADMFEEAFGSFAETNPKVRELLIERRNCLNSNPDRVSEIESKILEEI